MSARSQGVRTGPGGPRECPGGRRTVGSRQWLGPGNTNVAGRWVGRGSTHPPVYPSPHQPRYTTLPVPTRYTTPVHPSSSPTRGMASTKEILGVDNAQCCIARLPHASPYACPRGLPAGARLWEPAVRLQSGARGPGLRLVSSIQYPVSSIQVSRSSIQYPVSSIQYLSVILSISQYFSVFSFRRPYQPFYQ